MKITIRDILKPTLQAGLVFILSMIASYIYSYYKPTLANMVVDSIKQDTQSALNPILAYEAWNIFSHNFEVSLIMIIFGAIIGYVLKLKYGSFLLLATNGFIIGIVTYVYTAEAGFILFLLLTMVHGIVELPTLFLSAGLGVVVSTRLAKREFDKEAFISSIKILIFVVLPLYALSAIIEAFVTGGIIVPAIKQLM
jgi:stage II sporulation protein M